MKKFKFKLQKLLEIREAIEKEVKNELARLVSFQNMERTKQQELNDNIERMRLKFQERMRKGDYSINEGIYFEKFVDLSYRAIDAAEKRIMQMEPEVDAVRQKLINVSKERKVVEKMKERKLKEYNYELNREIAKENDDLNQKIYLRKKMEVRYE